jgi:LPXTG-motif cell wall-anchored protein
LVRWTRRTASAVLAVVTTLALTAPAAIAAPTTTDDPAEAAAGWLASQLDPDQGALYYEEFGFTDLGGTIDLVLALGAVGVAADAIATATATLEARTDEYAAPDGQGYRSGALGKLLLLAAATGRDAEAFGAGGLNLIVELEELQDEDGRFTDAPSPDYASPITQAIAILGLERTAPDGASVEAITFLADQACDDGGFPLQYVADGGTCTSATDSTALAAQALLAAGEDASAALGWLVGRQDENEAGDVGGNANSTGLAAQAFAEAGLTDALDAAQRYLVDLQQGCDGDEPGAIEHGGDDPFAQLTTSTAQALPGLVGIGLASIDATGASSDVPTFDCPAPVVEEEPEVEPAEQEPTGEPEGGSSPPTEESDDEPQEGTEAEEGELPRTGTTLLLLTLLGAALVGAGTSLLRRPAARPVA